MKKPQAFDHLVVIGSSAGGVTALSTLVASLPRDFPAPLVVAQHLDPARPSHLGEILARRSTLPVRTVTGEEALEPGVVYVIPSNRHVEVTDHAVRLSTEAAGRSKPSVDVLLSTAAAIFGENLIAVILTGSGSDGAVGARAVKAAGGTVVIQDPETAEFPAMPRSLAPTSVDVVVNLESMGSVLQTLTASISPPREPTDEEALRLVLAEVRSRQGLDFSRYKTPTILRRLRSRMAATGTDTFSAYQTYLELHPAEPQRLVQSFLINVTEFFRDQALFDHLRHEVLPELIAYGRQNGNELRLWSAGCATGEEAYSLAILIAEALGGELERFSIRFFATDLDVEAITFARRGVSPAAALGHVAADLVTRYFTQVDGAFEVKKSIRALVVFGEHDLGHRPPFPRIDLVLCRNVLIYFTQILQIRALQLFAFALRDGGYLMLGNAETPRALQEYFQSADPSLRIYRRQGPRTVLPPNWSKEVAPITPIHAPAAARRLDASQVLDDQRPAPGAAAPGKDDPRKGEVRPESLMDEIPLGVVVVDRRYGVRSINRAARRFFGIYEEAIGADLIHLAHGVPVLALRTALDAVFREGSSTRVAEVVPVILATGEECSLDISCRRSPAEPREGTAPTVMVLISDVTAVEQARAHTAAELERLTARTREMSEANRLLLAANDALAGANVEMRQDTVEAQSSTADAQAQTEEVITLNEELQATNEEMETLNEELQATIEELETANDELDARRKALEELAWSVESARAHLEVILGGIGDAVLVVDRAGSIRRTIGAYDALFGKDRAGLVLEDARGVPLPVEAWPRARAARGETFNVDFCITAADGARSWFEAHGQPLPSHDTAATNGEQETVVVIRDITLSTQQRRLQDEFLSLASHELRTPITAIQGFLSLLEQMADRPVNDARVRNFVTKALHSTRQLGLLVRDLTDVSRLQTGKLQLHRQPLELGALCEQVVEIGRDMPPGHIIHFASESTPVTVLGDATRLEQVLFNLLTNAMVHAPSDRPIEVRLRHMDGSAVLEVQDHGKGVAPDHLPRLFSRFYQVEDPHRLSRGGMGLGLFICKELVIAHGGQIEVASVLGAGTTFTVSLPIMTREVEETGAS